MSRRPVATVGPVLGVLLGLLLALLPAPPTQARGKLPVPYDFLPAAVLGALPLDGSAPGSNDWSCRPTRAHPRPVVLVHGLLGNRSTNWQTFSPLLKNNGYCVFALTYGVPTGTPTGLDQLGGLARMEGSARQLKAFVNRVLRATGARKVDILGHSEGTVMPDYYAKYLGGASKIRHYISLAPIWHGTSSGGLDALYTLGAPFGVTALLDKALAHNLGSTLELLTHSAFIKMLRRGGTPAVKGIAYTNIVTKYDELVSPYTSGVQRGMKNYVLQDLCSRDFTEHFEIAADPVAARVVLNTLDPRHRRPVPCRTVLPFVGG